LPEGSHGCESRLLYEMQELKILLRFSTFLHFLGNKSHKTIKIYDEGTMLLYAFGTDGH
jgi:hypothetical protein